MTEQVLIEIRERVVRIETILEGQKDIRKDIEEQDKRIVETEARSKSNTHRIDRIEANLNWLWRTIAGCLIGGAISAWVMFK